MSALHRRLVGRRLNAVWFGLVCAGFAGMLGWSLLNLPDRPVNLDLEVAARIETHSVANPVTGVLLDFRAYDTLLEIAVMIVALAAVWSSSSPSTARPTRKAQRTNEQVLESLVRSVVPLMVLTAAYLAWIGAHAPGGAFQAGALLAGGGVLLLASGRLVLPSFSKWWLRGLASAALLAFIAAGAVPLASGSSFLQHPLGASYALILLIEGAITFSTALVLVALFAELRRVPRLAKNHGGVPP